MANTRQVIREIQFANCTQECVELLDKIHKRYYSYYLFLLILFNITELNA